MESSGVVLLNQFLERFGVVASLLALGSDLRDFNQHRGDVVSAVDQSDVDLHVEGNSALEFLDFLLFSTILAFMIALSENFLDTLVLSNFDESFLSLFDKSEAESSQTNLCHRSVVKHLQTHVLVVNNFGHICLE